MTPAIVVLTAAGVDFTVHEFTHEPSGRNYGIEAAEALGVEHDRVFKTLLADVHGRRGSSRPVDQVVGVVPVTGQLSLRKLAAATGAKRAEMCAPDVAERLTGYVVGGISPFGQKRRLPTVIDETCELWDTIFVSGGRRGLDVELAPQTLVDLLDAIVIDLV
ncbi:MAG: Cys-tRNA(Pro) deacylase [Ilumatobacteraceae bacterium]